MVNNPICGEHGKPLINVLLVDPYETFLRIARECLVMETGFKIETARSIEEAIIKLREKKTDVIVSELMFHHAGKFEFLKTLRNEDNKTPIIVFTIEEESNLADESQKMGAYGFIGKFGEPSLVFSKLKNCIVSAAETR